MDLRGLSIFIQVAELKSFSKTAEKLGYSQPTISFQIKQLEQELGVSLFDRIGHSISLTDAGKNALEYAQKICHISQEMKLVKNKAQELSGEVSIAMADSLCTPLLVDNFADFRKKYPDLSIHVTTGGTDEMFRLLDHNEVDIVCTLDRHIYDSNYVIANEECIDVHFVVSSKNELASNKPISIKTLLKQPFLLTEKGMSYRKILDEYLASQSYEINPILEIGNTNLLCRLVEDNVGISFLPDYVTENAVQKGTIVRLNVNELDIKVWKQILYHRNKWISAQMEAFLEHLNSISILQ